MELYKLLQNARMSFPSGHFRADGGELSLHLARPIKGLRCVALLPVPIARTLREMPRKLAGELFDGGRGPSRWGSGVFLQFLGWNIEDEFELPVQFLQLVLGQGFLFSFEPSAKRQSLQAISYESPGSPSVFSRGLPAQAGQKGLHDRQDAGSSGRRHPFF